MNVLAFELETIPDVEGGRRLYGLDGASDKDVATIMFHKRRQETGNSETLLFHVKQVRTISIVLRQQTEVTLLTFSGEDEVSILNSFFELIQADDMTTISWDACKDVLPVLAHRALLHAGSLGGIDLSKLLQHTDLSSQLGGGSHAAPLTEMGRLCGLPVLEKYSASAVWDEILSANSAASRQRCENRALSVFLLFLRQQRLSGQLSAGAYADECQRIREMLAKQSQEHLQHYLHHWHE